MFTMFTGHNFSWVWKDTGCDPNTVIETAVDWWQKGVLAIVGPGCTCDYEGRVAGSLNIPMLDYVSALSSVDHYDLEENSF